MWSDWVNSGSGMSSSTEKKGTGEKLSVDKEQKADIVRHVPILTLFCASLLVDGILQGGLSWGRLELVYVFNPNILIVESGRIDCGCHSRFSCVCHQEIVTTVMFGIQEKNRFFSFSLLNEPNEKIPNDSNVTNLLFPPFSARKNEELFGNKTILIILISDDDIRCLCLESFTIGILRTYILIEEGETPKIWMFKIRN